MTEPKDRSLALELVHDLHQEFGLFVRAVVTAYQDGNLTLLEGVHVGLQATRMAAQVTTLLHAADHAILQDVLEVLEHGQWTLAE